MSAAMSVTLTGTGVPHPSPGRAGAGTLVRYGDVALQFDAGRGTALRLAEAGVGVTALTAVFVTHIALRVEHVQPGPRADARAPRPIVQTCCP